MFIVTLPEATPVHEAASLQADLRRAGIEPQGWIINQSLTGSGTTDPVLAAAGDRRTALHRGSRRDPRKPDGARAPTP